MFGETAVNPQQMTLWLKRDLDTKEIFPFDNIGKLNQTHVIVIFLSTNSGLDNKPRIKIIITATLTAVINKTPPLVSGSSQSRNFISSSPKILLTHVFGPDNIIYNIPEPGMYRSALVQAFFHYKTPKATCTTEISNWKQINTFY